MEQTGVVIQILSASTALVEVLRSTACGEHACGERRGACGLCAASGGRLRTETDNPLGARVGDWVTVSTRSGRALGWAALLYLLPVCTLLLGILLAPSDGLWPCLGALCGLLSGLGPALLLGRRPLPLTITGIEHTILNGTPRGRLPRTEDTEGLCSDI